MGERAKQGVAPVVAVALLLGLSGVALAAGGGKLSLVGTKTQGVGGVDGIASPDDVAVSRDGKNVYAVGGADDGLATFKRDRETGKLKFVNAKFDGQGGIDGLSDPIDVAVSPDGKSVYVTGSDDSAIATFKRDRDTGKLKFVNAKFDGQGGVTNLDSPYALVVSHDNRNVYVTVDSSPGALVTFKRDRDNGKLKFVNAKLNGQGGVEGIDNPEGIAASDDGNDVYVTGVDSIATFRRDRHGKLHLVNAKFDGQGGVDGLAGAYEPIVSRDGKNAYVTGYVDDAVATFKRDRDTGKLKFVNAKFDGQDGLPLVDPYDVVVSRDGDNVYVAFYNGDTNSGLDTFKRNRRGKLKFVNAKRDEMGGLSGIGGLWRVAISPDDDNLYTADFKDSSVGIFKRHH